MQRRETETEEKGGEEKGTWGGLEEKLAKNYDLQPLLFVCGHDGRSFCSIPELILLCSIMEVGNSEL